MIDCVDELKFGASEYSFTILLVPVLDCINSMGIEILFTVKELTLST